MKVGFIGTGRMGNPMAMHLLQAGFDVVVNELLRPRSENLLAAGAAWAESARELGEQCEVVFTSLPGPKQFEEVLTDTKTGLLAGLKPGGAIFDTTTNSPFLVRKIAEACQQRGVHLLDAPVSGGSIGADAGTLTFMVGGDKTTFDKYQPLLEAMGTNLFHLGEVGQGCAAKLVTQYIGYTNFITAAEALLVARKAGLDLATMYKVVPVTVAAFGYFELMFRSVLSRNLGEGTGSVNTITKDLMLANELAQYVDSPHEMGLRAYGLLKATQERGMGDYGLTTVVQLLEEEAGVELKAELYPQGRAQ